MLGLKLIHVGKRGHRHEMFLLHGSFIHTRKCVSGISCSNKSGTPKPGISMATVSIATISCTLCGTSATAVSMATSPSTISPASWMELTLFNTSNGAWTVYEGKKKHNEIMIFSSQHQYCIYIRSCALFPAKITSLSGRENPTINHIFSWVCLLFILGNPLQISWHPTEIPLNI